MKVYAIGYDLNKWGQNYDGLIEAIKELANGWWHHLDSTWIVCSDLSAEQILDYLAPYIDSNDELLVVRLSGESAWKGFSSRGSDWLYNALSPLVSV